MWSIFDPDFYLTRAILTFWVRCVFRKKWVPINFACTVFFKSLGLSNSQFPQNTARWQNCIFVFEVWTILFLVLYDQELYKNEREQGTIKIVSGEVFRANSLEDNSVSVPIKGTKRWKLVRMYAMRGVLSCFDSFSWRQKHDNSFDRHRWIIVFRRKLVGTTRRGKRSSATKKNFHPQPSTSELAPKKG